MSDCSIVGYVSSPNNYAVSYGPIRFLLGRNELFCRMRYDIDISTMSICLV